MTKTEYIQSKYKKNRFMESLSDDSFMARFNDVLQNLITINDDAKISIPSPKNERTIFWTNHWIQVLAEEQIRFTGLTRLDTKFIEKTRDFLHKIDTNKLKKIRSIIGNKQWLFKYGKKEFLERIITDGKMLIRPASAYNDFSLNKAIKDNELQRSYRINSNTLSYSLHISYDNYNEEHTITTNDYHKKMNTDYYVYSLSQNFDPRLFNDFDADSCLIIKRPEVFIRKIRRHFFEGNEYKIFNNKIDYYDPLLDNPLKGKIPFTKYFGYSYQKEYRCAFIPKHLSVSLSDEEIYIGNVSDYVEIVDIYQ